MTDNTRNPNTIFERLFSTEETATFYLASLLGNWGEPESADIYKKKLHNIELLKEFFMTTAYAHPERDSYLEMITEIEEVLRSEFNELGGDMHA